MKKLLVTFAVVAVLLVSLFGFLAWNFQNAATLNEAEVKQLQNQILQDNQTVNALQSEKTILETELTSYNRTIQSLDSNLTSLENQITSLQKQIIAMRDSLAVQIEPFSVELANGDSQVFNANVLNGTAPYTYNWTYQLYGVQKGEFVVAGAFSSPVYMGCDSSENFTLNYTCQDIIFTVHVTDFYGRVGWNQITVLDPTPPNGPYYLIVPSSTWSYEVSQFSNGSYYSVNGSDWSVSAPSSNASAVINNAIGNCTYGSEVFFNNATYYLSVPILVTKTVNIVGANNMGVVFYNNANTNMASFNVSASNVCFSNIELYGNIDNQGTTSYGIYGQSGANVMTIENCESMKHQYTVYLYGSDNLIIGNEFGQDNNAVLTGTIVYLGGSGNVVNDNKFYSATNIALEITGSSTYNTVDGNRISYSATGVYLQNCYNSTFEGNTILENTQQFFMYSTNTNNTVTGNTFLGSGTSTFVSGNYVYNNGGLASGSSFSFLVYTDGTNYYAQSGTTGSIVSSGTNAATVGNYALSNLPNGRTSQATVVFVGSITTTASLIYYRHTHITILGSIQPASGLQGDFNIFQNNDTVNGDFDVTFDGGGMIYGNRANQTTTSTYNAAIYEQEQETMANNGNGGGSPYSFQINDLTIEYMQGNGLFINVSDYDSLRGLISNTLITRCNNYACWLNWTNDATIQNNDWSGNNNDLQVNGGSLLLFSNMYFEDKIALNNTNLNKLVNCHIDCQTVGPAVGLYGVSYTEFDTDDIHIFGSSAANLTGWYVGAQGGVYSLHNNWVNCYVGRATGSGTNRIGIGWYETSSSCDYNQILNMDTTDCTAGAPVYMLGSHSHFNHSYNGTSWVS
jgi:parallel beta-helix repeat protein